MKNFNIGNLTTDDAYYAYKMQGVCCIHQNGEIMCEEENEDYCD